MGKDKKHKKKHKDTSAEEPTSSTAGSYGPALPPQPTPARDSWMSEDTSSLFDSVTYSKADIKKEKEKEKTPEYDYSAPGLHIMDKASGPGLQIMEKSSANEDSSSKNRLFARHKPSPSQGDGAKKNIEMMKARFKIHNKSNREEEKTDDSRSRFRAPDSRYQRSDRRDREHHSRSSRTKSPQKDRTTPRNRSNSPKEREHRTRERSNSPRRRSRRSSSPRREERQRSRSRSPDKHQSDNKRTRRSPEPTPAIPDKDVQSSSKPEPPKAKEAEPEKSSEKIVTDDDLNKLSARIVKAEIMGSNEKVAKLNTKLAELRKLQRVQSSKAGSKETVILTSVDKKGNVRPVMAEDIERPAERKRRKEKTMNTHSSDGVRDKYFPDDNNKELSDLVRDEKSMNQLGHDELFMKYAGKLSKMSQDRQNWTLDDMFETNIATIKHKSGKDVDKIVAENAKEHKKLESCFMCLEKCSKEALVHIGKTLYVRVPTNKSLTKNHCQIIPINHIISTVNGDEDFWDELSAVKAVLTKSFSKIKMDIVFMELAQYLGSRKHIFIDCIPVPLEESALLPAFFKKSILDSDVEWSQNKKLVDTRAKGLRRSVPQGLPYFSVEFGTDGGYAHVIEDESLFKRYFGLEIVGGVLDCDMNAWRHPEKESDEGIKYKKSRFEKLSMPF